MQNSNDASIASVPYIARTAEDLLERLRRAFPCVALTGPRQSGKTTLARRVFPEKPWVSLEDMDEREFAEGDPRGFLARFPDGALLDEVQRCPSLFSYLQGHVDRDGRMGLFVLTGSQPFHLTAAITQSLAGRVGMVHLPPLTLSELRAGGRAPESPDAHMLVGGYPALQVRPVSPAAWHGNYIDTYVERDVRSLVNVRDLSAFRRFLRLCAGRVGQLVNLSALGADCGIALNTAKAWMSVLEGSDVLFLLRPFFENLGKRLVKTPKLYFLDTGMACRLLGIEKREHLETHPLRGSLFENAMIAEVAKERMNRGEDPDLYFWRDSGGTEIDLILDRGTRRYAVEMKSGRTLVEEFFRSLNLWKQWTGASADDSTWLVYGGDSDYRRSGHRVLSWASAGEILGDLPASPTSPAEGV